jgi:hypothetical protein
MMNLGMSLLQGDTTQSLIHGTKQVKIDTKTGHDQFESKSFKLSTKESRSNEHQPIMPWPQ